MRPMAPITGRFDDLSEDVVADIFARLPVKSLLQFKSIRKSWYALIESPSFIGKHLKCTSLNDGDDDNTRIAVKYCIYFFKRRRACPLRKACISFMSNKAVEISHDMASPFFEDDSTSLNNMLFYGSCNGIICVVAHRGTIHPSADDPIALWNPATREIVRLSVPDFRYRDGANVHFVTVGFGFDTRSNDYKVIRIIDIAHRKNQTQIFDPVVEVYYSSTDAWKKMEAELLKNIQITTDFSIYLNGFSYWLAHEVVKGALVLSFDFADEVFEKIPLPSNRVSTLAKFNETIAVTACEEACDFTAVWVLNINGDGEKKTWTKLYNIPSKWGKVLGLLKSGGALMTDQNGDGVKLALYDSSTQHIKNLRVYDPSGCNTFQMVDYVESLVSFKGAFELHN